MKTILVVLLMSASITAFAGNHNWKTQYGDDGSYYIVDGPVRDGSTNWIKVPSKKQGEKLAKKLNKQKKKDSKGFWNEQYCLNPDNRC